MRPDGRVNTALRPVTIERDYTAAPEASVLVCFGNTRVLCTATIEGRVPAWLRDSGRGWVTAEYGMLPRSTQDRLTREAYRKGRSMEIGRLIGRSLRAVVDLGALAECQVILDCDVLQADGGTRTASITGAYVALYDALRKVYHDKRLPCIPIPRQCAAVSLGIVDGEIRLDLCYEEDAAADVDLNLVMDSEGHCIEVQASAEGAAFSRAQFDAMLDLGAEGIQQLFALQRKVLEL